MIMQPQRSILILFNIIIIIAVLQPVASAAGNGEFVPDFKTHYMFADYFSMTDNPREGDYYQYRHTYSTTATGAWEYYSSTDSATGYLNHTSMTMIFEDQWGFPEDTKNLVGTIFLSDGTRLQFNVTGVTAYWVDSRILYSMEGAIGRFADNFMYFDNPAVFIDLCVNKSTNQSYLAIGPWRQGGLTSSQYNAIVVPIGNGIYITGYQTSSDGNIWYEAHEYTVNEVGTAMYYSQTGGIGQSALENLIETIKGLATTAWDILVFVLMIFGLFKFVFIDNFILVIVLYVCLTGVMALSSSRRDILQSISVWANMQVKLFMFIIAVIEFVLGVIQKIADVFIKWI